jgi:hypothetical protein
MSTRIAIYLAAVFIIATRTVIYAETLEVISDPAFVVHRKAPVPFQHDLHNEKAGIETCQGCHHVVVDGVVSEDESSEDRPCSECHRVTGGPSRSLTLASAFHKRCRTCHLDEKKGPIVCRECHRKTP